MSTTSSLPPSDSSPIGSQTFPPVPLQSVELHGLLSFGRQAPPVQLEPLNVFIGANAAGKSNLLDALSLLKGTPRDLAVPIREGGGISEWLWKGEATSTATIETVVAAHQGMTALRYRLVIGERAQRVEIVDEVLQSADPEGGQVSPTSFFRYDGGRPSFGSRFVRGPSAEDLNPSQSVLAQRKDPDAFPELTYVGRLFDSIRVYRDAAFGRQHAARRPQPADLENDYLREDVANIGLIVNRLRKERGVKRRLIELLRQVYEDAEDLDVSVVGGSVQLFLQERSFGTPAARISDGTLRWIILLAILLDPSPPPVLCLEEPEIGLHPDVIRTLATVLQEASERCQVLVTTHSDVLVDALSDKPEAVVVVEKADGGTTFRRLRGACLREWLNEYSLGHLWRTGRIGGNRW